MPTLAVADAEEMCDDPSRDVGAHLRGNMKRHLFGASQPGVLARSASGAGGCLLTRECLPTISQEMTCIKLTQLEDRVMESANRRPCLRYSHEKATMGPFACAAREAK